MTDYVLTELCGSSEEWREFRILEMAGFVPVRLGHWAIPFMSGVKFALIAWEDLEVQQKIDLVYKFLAGFGWQKRALMKSTE